MNSEDVAYWYFRLNGFFTIANFVLHPRSRGSQLTDADMLGVRFPFRAEFPEGPEADDLEFRSDGSAPFFVIAEVTTGECKLNGPWRNPKAGNIQRVFEAAGLFRAADAKRVAAALHRCGRFKDPTVTCSLFCVGDRKSDDITENFPDVPQRTWSDLLHFIWQRFRAHRRIKTDNRQWGPVGTELWRLADLDESAFQIEVRRLAKL